jgi:iron complex outermembrane receptor protein
LLGIAFAASGYSNLPPAGIKPISMLKNNKTLLKLLILFWPVFFLFTGEIYGQIYGRCIDGQTGSPITNVALQHNEKLLATTNESGHFSFASDSSITINISHINYRHLTKEVVPGRENLFILTPTNKEIDEVTVSAPMLNYQSNKVPAGFSVIPSDTLHKSLTAVETIEQSPGVMMQKGAINTGRITIRGIGSRSPYATTRIRADLDDIPLTSGDGHTTIEDLEMYNMARTEIVRGPSSALYGSGLGGVIVFHPDHTQPTPLSAEAMVQKGPFDQTKTLLTSGIRKNRTIIKATGSYTQTSGFRENNDYKRLNAQVMLRQHWENHSLFVLANYIDLFAQIPSSLNFETYTNSPGKAAANWLAIEGYEEYQKWLSGATLKSDITNGLSNKISVYLNHINAYEPRPFNILDDQMRTYGFRDEITWKTALFELTGGAEIFNEKYRWQLLDINDGVEGEMFNDNHETRRYINVFGKLDMELLQNWNLSAGANMHYLEFNLVDNFEDEENLSNQYSYAPVLSPRMGITGDLNTNLTLFASGGHGFSPPSVEETLLPEGNINPDLEPEEGWNFDAGIRGNLLNRRLKFDVTAYHISLENLLVTKRETEEIFYGINAGETRHMGLESQINTKLTRQLSPLDIRLNLTHTWMDNKFTEFVDEGNDYSGNQLPGIPEHYMRSTLLTTRGNSHLRLEWNYSSAMYLNDGNTRQYEGHHIFNLKASHNFQTREYATLKLQAGL